MRQESRSKSAGHGHQRLGAMVAALALAVSVVPPARAADDDAAVILKAMSDYVTNQKTLSITFDTDIEAITPTVQKSQFASSGEMLLIRPDKLLLKRTDGYSDAMEAFDGTTFTVYGKDINVYGNTVDAYAVTALGADLLLSHVYDELMADVIEAKHIGRGVINGIECVHLAFRNQEVSHAQARVGRPLKSLSYAGVARRTTRRTGAVGAAAGVAAAPVVVAPAPACVQVVNAYGQITYRCP